MSGLFGVVSKEPCAETLFYGTDYHSHLGTEYGGIAILGEHFTRQIHNLSQSQFKSKFHDDYKTISGNKGIGVISDYDEQPIYLKSKFGPFCIVTSGFVENAEKLTEELLNKGVSFSEFSQRTVNTSELIAKLINQGDDLVDGIQKMFDAIEGSCSLLLLDRDGIYAARDRFGYTPLTVGKRQACPERSRGDAWAVTTETTAFANTGFEVTKHIAPGEIILINQGGASTCGYASAGVTPASGSGPAEPVLPALTGPAPVSPEASGPATANINQICAFLWIYAGFPASSYEGINVEIVRERCGRYLAKRDKDIDVDLVCGVPDSGCAHGLGYAMESGKPFRRPLVKYTPGYGRSYIPPSQETRDLVAKMKLIPIKEIIQGNSIVVCEDSIVRGTQLRNFTIKKLWDCGARAVHIRPACPPLMFPCKFGFSTRSTHELAARKAISGLEGHDLEAVQVRQESVRDGTPVLPDRPCRDVSEYIDHNSKKYKKMVDWIAKDLGVTTLRYQTVDDMVKAIGRPKDKLCLYCWTGECPAPAHPKPMVEIVQIRKPPAKKATEKKVGL